MVSLARLIVQRWRERGHAVQRERVVRPREPQIVCRRERAAAQRVERDEARAAAGALESQMAATTQREE